jgi:hypothetical protein
LGRKFKKRANQMINNVNQDTNTWQAMAWRLVLTIALLVLLFGFSLTVSNSSGTRQNTQVVPGIPLHSIPEN